jgi:hypothetical protein
MSVVVVVVGIELVVHALDIVSAYAHNDNSQDVVDFASDAVGSVAAAVDPVSAVAVTVEAEDDTPVLALAIEPEPA